MTLVLGTMPGQASLDAREYYAHPRNAFWPIMQSLFGIDCGLDYDTRTVHLVNQGIALWDVLAEVERPGSLDSDILPGSMTTNYFPGFLAAHPGLQTIFFNGRKAEQLFSKLVLPELTRAGIRASMTYLPSTSPANTMTLEQKTDAWSVLVSATRVA